MFPLFLSSCITAKSSQRQESEAKTFIAFSLKAAEAKIKKAQEQGQDFHKACPEVCHLGYMTKPIGLVFEPVSADTIIIGERNNAGRLMLDDFVSALRALRLYGKYPAITIDPEGGNPQAKWHIVNMAGGIEHSRFGRVFFESDYLLKKIALNLAQIRLPRFKTQYRLMIEKRKKGAVFSRFWFNPRAVDISVSENAVLINRYPLEVSSETLSPKHIQDDAAIEFARSFSQRFDEFAEEMPVFEDLRNLQRWVGIAHSIKHMDFSPDLNFWLRDYGIQKVQIPGKVRALSNVYGDLDSVIRVSGGVESIFLDLRLKAGDAAALSDLADLVINSRPSQDALTWDFPLQELKSSAPIELKADISEIERFFYAGILLLSRREYEEAIDNFTKVIGLIPDFAQAYLLRAACYGETDNYDGVVADCRKIIEIDPGSFMAYSGLGLAYSKKGLYEYAISNFDKAIEINPDFSMVWREKGNLLYDLGKYQEALACYDWALKISPQDYTLWLNKGGALENLKKEKEAIKAYEAFLETAPADDPDIEIVKSAIRRLKEYNKNG